MTLSSADGTSRPNPPSQAVAPEPKLNERKILQTVRRHGGLVFGLFLLAMVALTVLLGPFLFGTSPNEQSADRVLLPPSGDHLFGTDAFGRDVLARVLVGGRYTIIASIMIVLLGGFFGTLLGLVAGFWGGALGFLIMRFVDLMLAFPGILLALLAASILGPGLVNGVLAVAIVLIPIYARVVEGATVATRRLPYIEAAEVGGMGSLRIIWHHVLPNIRSGIVVLTSTWIGLAALWIAGLGFLGLGVQPPTAEWGVLVHDGSSLITLAWWVSTFPGIFLAAFVVGANFVGDGLRDVLDPTVVKA